MTQSMSLEQIAGKRGDDGIRRNQWGQAIVVPLDGSDPRGYPRVTTVIGATDDRGGLISWKAALATCGALITPGIEARWRALIAEHVSPWYAGDGPKEQCKKLVEEAARAGGAENRRDQGDALHRVTAIADRGESIKHLGAEMRADLDAYHATLDRYGISIVPGMIEVSIVIDGLPVHGTFDRLLALPDGRTVVGDLKTGADIQYSRGAFQNQLAAYAHGDAIYRQGATPADDVREPMPVVDQTEGLIIWAPAGSATCELYSCDLVEGWIGFLLAHEVYKWRQTVKGAPRPYSQFSMPARPTLRAVPELGAIDLLEAKLELEAELDESLESALENAPVRPVAEKYKGAEHDASLELVRAWLQTRIDVIGEHTAARVNLGQLWPQLEVPTLRDSSAHTRAQLDKICRLLDDIEARHSIPFGATDPSAPAIIRRHFPDN